jgi:hypothetical protein
MRPGVARFRASLAERRNGADHPATRAAIGRAEFHNGTLPTLDAGYFAFVAWQRESGEAGYRNRGIRKHFARLARELQRLASQATRIHHLT